VAQKKSRQTFEKLKREQAVKERRLRKQERKAAARLAKLDDSGESADNNVAPEHPTVASVSNGRANDQSVGYEPSG
jgi:hypothetical protein